MPDAGRGGVTTPARTVIVEPPSSRREAIVVARAVFLILFWSAVAIGLERGAAGTPAAPAFPGATAAPRESAESGEVALRQLDPLDQQTFREISSAVPEMEGVRSAGGAWPADPPFARNFGGYRWKLLRDGVVLNYVGLPDASTGRPTFVLVVVEPEPGIPSDPQAVTDEIHHRLADGSLLHVSIWEAPGVRDVARPMAAPAPEDGWRRVKK